MSNTSIEFNGKIYVRYSKYRGNKKNYFFCLANQEYLHRDIWRFYKGPIPDNFHIHHIDKDPSNNHIDNLECISPQDHAKIHYPDVKESFIKWHVTRDGKSHHSKLSKNTWVKRSPIFRKCSKCFEAFETFNTWTAEFKCKKCQRKYQKRKKYKSICSPKIGKCEICSKTLFQKTKSLKKFCSNKCKTKNRHHLKKDYEDRKCTICYKNFFVSKYSPTQTCSGKCRAKFISKQMKK